VPGTACACLAALVHGLLDAATTPGASGGFTYEPRRPETGTLYAVVRDNLQTLYAAVEDGFASPLPAFVRNEFERYLDCGQLCRGFALLKCETCHEQRLVAFSCKSRSFCPSCTGRRMAQTAANLVDHVLPITPLRQFVVTFPFELRARLAYDGKLLGAVTRIAIDSVLGFYKRRMRDEEGLAGQSGAVSVVQRVNSDLRLNPHLHAILLDGVFVNNGSPVFHPLTELDDSDLADLLQVIRVRVLGFLERKGIVESRHELTLLDDDFAERDPALAQLAVAAVAGLLPAGPDVRQRPPIALRGQPGIEVTGPLSVAEMGFSLHAATTASADDARGREALVRYALRPPIAQERLKMLPNELVRLELKRPFSDGTIAIDLDPLSLLCRLAASVPCPGFHLVHYSGVLGAASKLRALVVPPVPADTPCATSHSHGTRAATHRSVYRPYAELMRRTFKIDVEICPSCGGRLKLKALVIEAHNIERLLRHLGEPLQPPRPSPARDPPYFKSQVLRRKLGQLN
jgi:Putative transposase/Transposase zinc-binding domain